MSTDIINVFNAGELSPVMENRSDLAKVHNGCRTLKNNIVKAQGGFERRAGTEFITELKTQSVAGRLIPFVFSQTTAYVLELGNLFMRFIRDGSQIAEGDKTITGATAANPVVITATSHGYSDTDQVIISGVVGMIELNGRRFTVANKTANTFELSGIDGSAYTAYGSGGIAQKPYEIVTPWATADLAGIKYKQSANMMYFTHPDYQPQQLTRLADNSWTLTDFAFNNGPFLAENATTTSITPSYPAWATSTSYTANDVVGVDDAAKNPDSNSTKDINNGGAAVDKGGGLVGIPVTSHGYSSGDWVLINNTANYDGEYVLDATTSTNELVITATYQAETFNSPADDTVVKLEPAVDLGGGLVGFPVTAHGYSENDIITIAGTTNYDMQYEVNGATTANQVVIVATYVSEGFTGAETLTRKVHYKAKTTHTSGGGNPTPPGNTTDWETALTFTGTNLILTSSAALFDADMVGGLFKITHKKKVTAINGIMDLVSYSDVMEVKGGWSLTVSGAGWSGAQFELQRSFDSGATWNTIRRYQNDTQNVVTSGTEDEDDVLYRLANLINGPGQVQFNFTQDAYEKNAIVEITSFTSTTVVGATVIRSIDRLSATDEWCEGAWSDHRGWPYTVSFYDGRLCFSGNDHKPMANWFSKVDDYVNFDIGESLDDEAVIRTLDGDQINKIQWIYDLENLVIATAGGLWRLGPNDIGEPLTPGNITHRRQDMQGAADLMPVLAKDTILFVGYIKKRLIEAGVVDLNRYVTNDMIRLAEHLTNGLTIDEIAIANEPETVVWCVRSDGALLGFTYLPNEQIAAWHHHEVGGDVESVCVIPGTNEDEVYMIAERTINGSTMRFIERKKDQYVDDIEDYWGVDSGLNTSLGDAVTISSISSADPASVASTAHGLITGDKVKISNTLGMTEANDYFEVVKTDANNYTLKTDDGATAIDSTGWGALTSTGVAITAITNGREAVCTSVAHGLLDNYLITISAVVGMTQVNSSFYVIKIDADSYKLRDFTTNETVNSINYPAYVSGGSVQVLPLGQKVAKIFNGLNHLEAEAVAVLADGSVESNKTVSSGVVTLSNYANKVTIGLPFESVCRPMKPKFGMDGSSIAKKKRITKVIAQLHRSVSGKYGKSLDDLFDIPSMEQDSAMDTALPMFTGSEELAMDGGWDREADLYFVQDKPLPLALNAVIYDMETGSI